MILATEEERVRCFVRGLRTTLRLGTEHLVSTGRSLLDVVDHARTIEIIHRQAHKGSDKRARHQGSYSGSSLEAMIVEIGLDSGSSRKDFSEVSLVDQFMRLCQHLGVPSFVYGAPQ